MTILGPLEMVSGPRAWRGLDAEILRGRLIVRAVNGSTSAFGAWNAEHPEDAVLALLCAALLVVRAHLLTATISSRHPEVT